MANICKLEVEDEAKCSADKFFEMIKYSLHHLPAVFPDYYKSSDIIEGDGNSVGTVRLWKYVLPGTDDVFEAKENIEEMDDENQFMTLRLTEGNAMDHYTSFLAKICVSSKGDGRLVKWILEYEKAHDAAPDAHHYLDLITILNEKLDAHILAK